MKNRLARLTLGAAVVLVTTAPFTQASHAWTCYPPVGDVACLVVGTSCRAFDKVTGRGEICQLG